MRSLIRTDVFIAGLGPAGASTAAEASRAGVRVLAVDRKQKPGIPVQCAEFLPHLVGMEINDLAETLRQHIISMATYIEDAEPLIEEQFPGVMIDRAAFDAFLVARARASGADCRFGVGLRSLDADGTAILTDGTKVIARVIVGADGPRSGVGKAIGAENTEIAETRQITVSLNKPYHTTDIFLSAGLPGGYAWLFPKGAYANLGLGLAPAWRSLLKPLLEHLHRRLIKEGRVGAEISCLTGGAIPAGGMRRLFTKLGKATVLLCGDAAGLTNPITGAGIASAVISGKEAGYAAARLIDDVTDTHEAAAHAYAEEIEALFGTALSRALERRRALMSVYAEGAAPSEADLRKSWIAFPEYWAA
jgi:digeranylgeranylglycerophospholipid reductase